MGVKFKLLAAIAAIALIAAPAAAHSRQAGKNAHRKTAQAHGKRHYLLHHDHYHIDDPKHPRSPKWHPTNPHSGNFAD